MRARAQQLAQQAFGYLSGIREMRVRLFMACSNNEIIPQLRDEIYKEALAIAATVEVK